MLTEAEAWEKYMVKNMPRTYKKWYDEEKKYLKKHISKDSSILEVGCGNGRSICDIIDYPKSIVGIDHDKGIVQSAKKKFSNIKKIKILHAEAESLPFDNETFDHVICMTTFANFADKKFIILNEMKRILKKSGSIIISTYSENALEERLKIYDIGAGRENIRIQKNGTVIFHGVVGNIVSEQFSKTQLKDIFSKAELAVEDITELDIAYICTLRKHK